MAANEKKDTLEVAHLTGVQGIRAAMAALAAEGADAPVTALEEEVPRPRKTCVVCAADNEGTREVCAVGMRFLHRNCDYQTPCGNSGD